MQNETEQLPRPNSIAAHQQTTNGVYGERKARTDRVRDYPGRCLINSHVGLPGLRRYERSRGTADPANGGDPVQARR